MTNVDDARARSTTTGIQSLIARDAGYSVAAECLRVQAEAELADPSLRSSDRIQLHRDAWSWYQGALGEIHVGQLLCALGAQWRVLHSVPIGAKETDVDHILIGPNGVFVLNTKHHTGASIWVGDYTMMINQAKKRTSKSHRGRITRSRNAFERRSGLRSRCARPSSPWANGPRRISARLTIDGSPCFRPSTTCIG